jgi:hypothetical protein
MKKSMRHALSMLLAIAFERIDKLRGKESYDEKKDAFKPAMCHDRRYKE